MSGFVDRKIQWIMLAICSLNRRHNIYGNSRSQQELTVTKLVILLKYSIVYFELIKRIAHALSFKSHRTSITFINNCDYHCATNLIFNMILLSIGCLNDLLKCDILQGFADIEFHPY